LFIIDINPHFLIGESLPNILIKILILKVCLNYVIKSPFQIINTFT